MLGTTQASADVVGASKAVIDPVERRHHVTSCVHPDSKEIAKSDDAEQRC
jgi:hypothetical protein